MKSKKQILKSLSLPVKPGVYYFKDARGRILYVGKAADLRRRVSSYFQKAHDVRIEQLVSEIAKIDYKIAPSVLEALILEANEIRRWQPRYNIRERDDKSYLYLVFTKEKFPKPQLVRGQELKKLGEKKFKAVYGPYVSAGSLRAALKILRKIFPYSTCEPGQRRSCFYYHLKQCPGVCVGAIDAKTYGKIIRQLGMVFAGKKQSVIAEIKREMRTAAKTEQFEKAAKLRNQIFALEHIRDVALLNRDQEITPEHSRLGLAVNIFGRIEGYDISNIGGAEAVGSMVVFQNGEPAKSEYRKFKIKTVRGANDVAMLKEILRRRFAHSSNWGSPDLLVIDGGWGQVNAAKEVLAARHLEIRVIGLAKGFKRKQDRPIHDKNNPELTRIAEQYKDLLLRVRDEAHRFARAYHRKRMRQRLGKTRTSSA